MLDEAIKAEITDLYDGSFGSIRELSTLFGLDNSQVMYFVDYKGYKKKCREATKKWGKNNLERYKEISQKAVKKYHAKPGTKIKIHERYLKAKESGYYKTKKFKAKMRKYYSENIEHIKEVRDARYSRYKKEGYFNTKEFKEKRRQIYLKRKLSK